RSRPIRLRCRKSQPRRQRLPMARTAQPRRPKAKQLPLKATTAPPLPPRKVLRPRTNRLPPPMKRRPKAKPHRLRKRPRMPLRPNRARRLPSPKRRTTAPPPRRRPVLAKTPARKRPVKKSAPYNNDEDVISASRKRRVSPGFFVTLRRVATCPRRVFICAAKASLGTRAPHVGRGWDGIEARSYSGSSGERDSRADRRGRGAGGTRLARHFLPDQRSSRDRGLPTLRPRQPRCPYRRH